MAKKGSLKLKRGDIAYRRVFVPISLYQAGAVLGFTAKPLADNDLTDAAAVLDKQFTDAVVDLVTNPKYAIYTITFQPADTNSIQFAVGEEIKTYKGEFQLTPSGGSPKSYPGAEGDYIEVTVKADIRRKTP